MKTKLIAALTAVTMTLFVGATEAKAQYASGTEATYILTVAEGLKALGYYDAMQDALTSSSEQTHLLRMGYGACLHLSRGSTPEDAFRFAIDEGARLETAHRALVFSAAAALTLCPEHSWMVQTSNTQAQPATYYSPERTYQES